jgi:AcrR family transcriptional regulator
MPQASRSPGTFDRDEKKTAIATAAVKVFAEKGIARAKMIEVAKEAGIGKGTIYEYFRSKDELFHYAVDRFFRSFNAQLQQALATTDDPTKRLEILVRTIFDSLKTSGPEMHIMLEIWAEGVRQGVEYFDLKGMYAGYRELIAGILTKGIDTGQFREVDPVSVAAAIIGALDGLMLQWILMEEALDLDKTPEELVRLIMNGISREQKP